MATLWFLTIALCRAASCQTTMGRASAKCRAAIRSRAQRAGVRQACGALLQRPDDWLHGCVASYNLCTNSNCALAMRLNLNVHMATSPEGRTLWYQPGRSCDGTCVGCRGRCSAISSTPSISAASPLAVTSPGCRLLSLPLSLSPSSLPSFPQFCAPSDPGGRLCHAEMQRWGSSDGLYLSLSLSLSLILSLSLSFSPALSFSRSLSFSLSLIHSLCSFSLARPRVLSQTRAEATATPIWRAPCAAGL